MRLDGPPAYNPLMEKKKIREIKSRKEEVNCMFRADIIAFLVEKKTTGESTE